MKKWIIIVVIVLILGIIGWMAADFLRSDKISKLPSEPEEKLEGSSDQYLLAVSNGETYPDELLFNVLDYVDNRYDCSSYNFV